MKSGRDKYQARENRKKVRDLLMREWDPIGVAGIPEAADEYDAYVAKTYVMMVEEDRNQDKIAGYLFEVASDYMGLGNPPGLRARCERTAELLAALKPSFVTS